jgi:hypothetical protein
MTPQLVLLALGSAAYPLLLAIVLVLLTAKDPPKLLFGYLVGGYAMSYAYGVLMILLLDAVGQGHQRSTSSKFGPWADVILGVLAIVGAVLIERHRRARNRDPVARTPRVGSGNERVDRILDKGSIRWMIVLGICLSLPSPFYMAAAKDIALDTPGWPERLWILVIFNIIIFLLVWVPLAAYLISPDGTRRAVTRLNRWLQANLLRLGVLIAYGLGVYEIIRGLTAL